MKLVSIDIRGMNKVMQKTYTFNPDVTYLNGKNGAGKSTVLNAVQLAILGYIPGLAKKNDAIMKHANGPFLSVTANFDKDGDLVQVSRVWTANKKGITCSVSTIPPNLDTSAIAGELELPVFNFSEFSSLSANKLKDWFISFLPSSKVDIDWKQELTSSLGDTCIVEPDFLEEVLRGIKAVPGAGVDQVRAVNAYLKQLQSFKKSESDRMNSSIQSLIFYDDYTADMSIADMEAQLYAYQQEHTSKLIRLCTYETSKEALSVLEKYQGWPDNIEDDPHYQDILSGISSTRGKLSELDSKITSNNAKLYDLHSQLQQLTSSSTGNVVCPYTKQACDTAAEYLLEIEQKRKSLRTEFDKVDRYAKSLDSQRQNLARKVDDLERDKYFLENEYATRNQYKFTLDPSAIGVDPDKLRDDINYAEQKMKELQADLVKAKANEKYNQLVDTFTQQKYRIQQSLEALKLWIKHTGENGLQTKFMGDPFLDLAKDLSTYLRSMFSDDSIIAHFELSSKANSFSFGIDRGGVYIPFDSLSSGEKCMYTIALLTCLVCRSSDGIKLILLDDLLDHLDEDSIENVFRGIQSVSGVQYAFAGVKPCKSARDCTILIE